MSFSVIIPSKSAANLVPCIRAIREAGETCRIIVVDDGVSTLDAIKAAGMQIAGEGAEWQKWCEDDKLLSADWIDGAKPFVFARNINIGIRAAGEDDVILLNDDALLKTPGGFSELAACAATGSVGLIAAACDTVGNPNQFQNPMYLNPGAAGMCRLEPRMVCFVCVYIPRSTINAVGLLDEEFLNYGLDDDSYCLRVRQAGLKIGIFDGCFVDHSSLTSSYRGAAGHGGDFTENMRIFIRKYGFDNWERPRETSPYAHLFPEAK